MGIGWQDLGFHRAEDLGESSNTGCGDGVSEVGLYGADGKARVVCVHRLHAVSCIANRGAGGMALNQ